ncbi:MAG: DJ-1/PfpI family protein [Candidatus Margulisbacteria bacterium]|nr:DJ-1/PfpI family protein [Candidatus Margulisiibacteriota bacterium]
MKRIAIVIAFAGFRDEEFFVPYNDLIKDFNVQVFSSQRGLAKGKLEGTFMVENLLEEIVPEKFDCLMLIGGPGGYAYLENENLKEIIRAFYSLNKLVSAICMAPLILAEAGVLDNKKVTVFLGEADRIKQVKGIHYTGKDVQIDGNIITADGASSAGAFSKKVREYLNG